MKWKNGKKIIICKKKTTYKTNIMKKKKDYSEIFGLVIALIASLYLGISTGKAAIEEQKGLAVIALAFLGIAVVVTVEIVKYARR